MLFVTSIFLLLTCNSDDDNLLSESLFRLNEPFQLTHQERATCRCNDDFSITFVDVLDDSICPPTAQCVWEGGVRVATTVRLPEVAIVELFRGASLEKEYIGQIDTVGNYIINIVNAEREENERENPAAYTIELLVTEL